MKKSLLSLLLVLALSLSLCAFAETPVTDRAGNPVTLPADPQKVVCLNSAACQTLDQIMNTQPAVRVTFDVVPFYYEIGFHD